MNVLSLFDGISCGRVALHRIGIKPARYFASEIDKAAIAVTQANWPDTIQLGDVTKIRRMIETGMLPKIDLLIAGSPCQGFSNGGLGLNFADPRSRLFFDFVEIKKLVNAKHFMLENVKMKQQWVDIITSFLGVTPVFIDSQDFSAQSRKRFYWTDMPIQPWNDKRITLNDVLEPGWCSDRTKSYCIDANYGKGTNFKRYFHRGSRQIVFRENKIPKWVPEEHANLIQRMMPNDWRKLSHLECERLQTLPENYTQGLNNYDRYHVIGNGWTVDVIAHIMGGMSL